MPAKREQQLKDFAKPEHKVFPEKRASLHPKKEKTLLSHLLKRAGLADNETSEPVFPGSEIGKVQPIGEAREKTSLTPVPTQSVGSQLKQPSIVLPQSSKNMSKDQSHIAARESGAPLHTKEPTQSFSKLPDGNIAKPFSKMKQGSIDYSRNTGVADVDGEIYVNGNDVELLGKLGFEYSESSYNGLEKTSEALDLYSYIEKVAGVPKEVAKLIDAGQAFSGEYLKDMGYKLPKGYEVKGDLVCRVEKTEQSFQQTGKEKKESSEKTAAADPAQTILITGHSGSGKTTLSRQLAEKLGIPVRRVDAHRGWDNYIRGDDKRWKETLTQGTKEHSYFTNLVNRATRDTLKNAPAAGIIEGTQLGHLSPEELAKFKAHIVVGGTRDQSIAQRIQRSVDKASKQGISFSPEEMAAKKIKAEYVANFWEPGVEKFRKLPGALNYNHSEHQIDPLVEQLKHLMGKQAEYKWHKSKDLHRDVTNGRHYPFSFLAGEAKELVDAIRNRDMANFKEELGDTTYAAQMLAAQATGLNHPVYADLSKFHNREKIWKDIFREKGSTYHPKHMEGGSNFAKPSKIIKALASAGIRISQKEAEKLANKYTGGKMEKEAAAPTQHYEGEAVKPFGGLSGGMGGGVGLQGQNTVGNNQPALRPTPPQLRPMPAQEAPEPVNPAPGSPVGVTNTSPTMSPGTGNVISTHAPLNVNNVSMGGQVTPPAFSEVYGKMKTRPIDFLVGATDIGANLVSPGGSRVLRTLDNIRQGVETSQMLTQNKPYTLTESNALDAIENIGGYVAGMPDLRAKVIGTGIQLGVKGGRLAGDYDQARAQLPDILTKQPVVPPSNYPATNFSIRPEQPTKPNVNIDIQSLAKSSEFTRFVEYFNKSAAADHPLVSSNIKAVGHDRKEKVLDVAFHSGGEYKYKDVPRGLYARLLKAKSPGKFFNKHIKKDKPFEYEKVAGMPEHIRKAIATGDKALLQAAQSKSVASRIANIAAKKRKLEVAKLLGNEEPKLLQSGEEFQKHFPFSVSHEFEQAKKIVDPSYRPDLSKYLGRIES